MEAGCTISSILNKLSILIPYIILFCAALCDNAAREVRRMTEKQRQYQKQWNRNHPEKVREYKRNSAIRRAIKEINSGKVVLVEQTVLAERHED